MFANESETVNQANMTSSVFYCWYYPNYSWDLGETTFAWLIFGITILASPVIFLLNAFEIVAVSRRRDLQRASTILLCSMALADIWVGAVSLPLTAVIDLLIAHQTFLDNVCILDLIGLAVMYCGSTSVLSHLTVIAWERYIAVKKWRTYQLISTRRRAKRLAVLAWLPSIVILPPYFLAAANIDIGWFENTYLLFQGVFWGSALTVIAYFYLMMYLEIRKLKMNLVHTVRTVSVVKQTAKIAKTTGFITGMIFLSFLLPTAIEILGKFFAIFQKSSVFRLTETIMQLNSLANPLIYYYRDRRFRNAIFEMLRLKISEENLPAAGAEPRSVEEINPERQRRVALNELPPQNNQIKPTRTWKVFIYDECTIWICWLLPGNKWHLNTLNSSIALVTTTQFVERTLAEIWQRSEVYN